MQGKIYGQVKRKLKESILNDATNGGGRNTSNASNDTTNTTTSANTSASNVVTRSTDTYIYGVGIVAVLATGVSIFYAYNKISSQTPNKTTCQETDREHGANYKSTKAMQHTLDTIVIHANK